MKTESVLRYLYEEKKWTDLKISLKLGVTEHQIGRLRRRFGINTIRRVDRNVLMPTSKQMQVLTGCLLGDGSLTKTSKKMP